MRLRKYSGVLIRIAVVTASLTVLMAAYTHVQAVSIMTDTANNFLNSLEPWQKTAISFKLEDEERSNWFYTPVARKGLALHDMKPYQRQLGLALIAAGLSQRGFIKAMTIMSLDEILLVLEPAPRRDPDNYLITIFGTPSATGDWGYRVEGHHISQNFTIVAGKIVGAPSFFGSNPATVPDGPRKGLRVLSREEDLGMDLLHSLTPEQMKTTVIADKTPGDVTTKNNRVAAMSGQPSGIMASAMTSAQRAKLQDLLDEYCDNMVQPIADDREAAIRAAGGNIWFAWQGSTAIGAPYYYRIQTATFVVEYDKTQSNGNHIHSVWRDFGGDFGRDLLKEHYETSHTPAAK